MRVSKVLQNGSVFDARVLDLSSDSILAKFKKAVGVQASLSLGAGFPTSASAPHSVLNGFQNLVAACAASDYDFIQARAILEAAKNAPAAGAAPEEKAAEAAVPVEDEKKSEEADVEMGNLFEEDEDY